MSTEVLIFATDILRLLLQMSDNFMERLVFLIKSNTSVVKCETAWNQACLKPPDLFDKSKILPAEHQSGWSAAVIS